MNRQQLAARIIGNDSIHSVAERFILEARQNTKWFKPIAAAKLAFVYGISFGDACSVIAEMDLTPATGRVE